MANTFSTKLAFKKTFLKGLTSLHLTMPRQIITLSKDFPAFTMVIIYSKPDRSYSKVMVLPCISLSSCPSFAYHHLHLLLFLELIELFHHVIMPSQSMATMLLDRGTNFNISSRKKHVTSLILSPNNYQNSNAIDPNILLLSYVEKS